MGKYVSSPVMKKDAMSLVTGKPVYANDIATKDKECLIVKILRSPHAHALIEDIQTKNAETVAGIAAVFTYKDVPQKRFTIAGQTYPELSPYDRLILDRHLRFVGDAVAIVAGETEAAVDLAMKRIKVKYEILPAILDPHEAKDNSVLIHPEENWEAKVPVGADAARNLCASGVDANGDVEKILAECDYVVEETYVTKANQQAMMEPFTTYCYLDYFGRLCVVAATQIPFHVRRILGNALDIPASKIRVIKPRIGGGFGAKQTAVCEMYPAFVTWKTGRPSKIVYSRYECQICSTPRHAMEMKVRVGANKDGIIRAIDLYTLSNTGAYSDHGPTTVGLSGHKSIPLYRNTEAFRFAYDVVYTNRMAAGAYRGYGATQGIFALESAIEELAEKIGMDSVTIRELNMPKEGGPLPCYDVPPIAESCTMDQCMEKVKKMMNWGNRPIRQDMGNGKVRALGVAMAMQGSSIAGVDTGGANIRLNEDGSYTLNIGCSDMGTGCDTILAQIAADCLGTDIDNIVVFGVDTDVSPYDSGSYASATTYTTGMTVTLACEDLTKKILHLGAKMLEVEEKDAFFDGEAVTAGEKSVSLKEIAYRGCFNNTDELNVTRSYASPISPPPYMVGMVEIEVDKETGSVEILDYAACVDCGTVINPILARVQTEGGILQGVGMALSEEVRYNEKGVMLNNTLMQYKIPSRMDIGKVRVEFAPSYEKSGPFGAKSIGELVINTPSPALANAIYHAVGVRIRELPITPEKIVMGILENQK